MGWRAIVFDLDDTLFPERQYVLSGMRAVSNWAERQFGIPRDRVFDELEKHVHTGIRNRVFDGWLASHGLEPARWVPKMVQVYREHTPQIAPFPLVVPVLVRCRQAYRLGLVTDGYLDVQRRKVAACQLAQYFDAIVFSDELGRDAWKPSTRPFLAVLNRLGVAADEAVYVGDNPAKDFRGARQVGMATIRVRHPDGLHRNVECASDEDAPDVEIARLPDLDRALGALAVFTTAPLPRSDRPWL